MAQYVLQLDRRTLFGKNMFNFLAGMNCVNEENPNVADVDERTADGKRIMRLLYAVGIVKSPYNPKFVAEIKQAQKDIDNGKGIVIDDIDKFIAEL